MATQEALFGPAKELTPTSRNQHFAQAAATSRVGQLPQHDPKSGQLPLMMTAREIRHHYRALDGDREDVYDGENNYRDETDDELYERKLYEAGDAPSEYGHHQTSPQSTNHRGADDDWGLYSTCSGSRTPSDSLYDDLPEEKSVYERLRDSNFNVRNPISLQFKDRARPGWDSLQEKEDPRPEVLGGHHRIAVMSEYAPDKLMPVNHEPDIWSARTSLKDRY